jgi:hypothetical protein
MIPDGRIRRFVRPATMPGAAMGFASLYPSYESIFRLARTKSPGAKTS